HTRLTGCSLRVKIAGAKSLQSFHQGENSNLSFSLSVGTLQRAKTGPFSGPFSYLWGVRERYAGPPASSRPSINRASGPCETPRNPSVPGRHKPAQIAAAPFPPCPDGPDNPPAAPARRSAHVHGPEAPRRLLRIPPGGRPSGLPVPRNFCGRSSGGP